MTAPRRGRTVGTGQPGDEHVPQGGVQTLARCSRARKLQEVQTAFRALPTLYETGTMKLQSGTANKTELSVSWSAAVGLLSRKVVGVSSNCFPSFGLQSDPCTRGWNLLQTPLAEGPSCQQVFFWEGPLVWYFKIYADMAVIQGFQQLPGTGWRLTSNLVVL